MANRSKFNWNDIPKLFPDLLMLRLHKGEGLTIDTLREFVKEFSELYVLYLPCDMLHSKEELDQFKEMLWELYNRIPTGTILTFNKPEALNVVHL